MNRSHKSFSAGFRHGMVFLGLAFTSGIWGLSQPKADDGKVLATFKGGEVTQSMAEGWLNFLKWDQGKIDESSFIEGLALTLAWFQEAQKEGLMKDPKLQDLWVAEWGALCKRQLMSSMMAEIQIAPQDVKDLVAAGKYAGREEKVRIRQIFKKYPDQSDQAQKQALVQEVKEIQSRIQNGASFSKLASKESDSQSRFREGLIGNVGRGDLDPRVEKILFALKAGEVSEPFLTKEGVMLFWCEKRIPAQARALKVQRQLAEKALKKEKFTKKWEAYIEGEKEKITILWERMLEDDPMTVLAKTEQQTFTRQEIGLRLANEVGETGDPWGELSKSKLQAQIEKLALDHLFSQRFELIRAAHKAELGDFLKWAEIKFWSLKYLEQEVAKAFDKPNEVEIAAYYKANIKKYQRKPYFDLSLIGLYLDKENLRSQTNLSKAIEAEVTSGKLSFEDAAKKYSELASAKQGGKLGWVPRFRVAGIGKEFLKVVDHIQPGQTGPWVRQGNVLYWAKVHGKQPARAMTLEEAKPRVLRKIANGKLWDLQTKVEDQWSEKIQFKLVQ